MDISSVTSGSYNRSVTPANSGSDRHANDKTQATNEQVRSRELAESRAQEQAQQKDRQQQRLENQRRLDGRLYTFGQPGGEVDTTQQEENRVNYTRERVKEAYTPPKNELTHSHSTSNQLHNKRQNEAIDLVV